MNYLRSPATWGMVSSDEVLRLILTVIGITLLLALLMMVVAWPMMGMWDGGHMWGWEGEPVFMWAMLFMWLVPLAVILAVGYLLIRARVHPDDRSTDPALEELRLAYARGDLSEDEFETRRKRLRGEG